MRCIVQKLSISKIDLPRVNLTISTTQISCFFRSFLQNYQYKKNHHDLGLSISYVLDKIETTSEEE